MVKGFFRNFSDNFSKSFFPSYFKYRLFHEKKIIKNYLNTLPDFKDRPLFSILIPLYGVELKDVKECFESIIEQTYKNWEICVCIDNDPKKKSVRYVHNLTKKYPQKIKLVEHFSNAGICKATKSALSLAKGDFVVFVDSDDRVHRKALEIFARRLQTDKDIDFLYSNNDHITDYGFRIQPMIKPGWSPELLLHVNYINHLKVIRFSLLKKIEPLLFAEDTNGAQDWDMCLKMINHARRVVHIPLILYHWRKRKGSMAAEVIAKPWAIAGQFNVRSRFSKEIDASYSFDSEKNSFRAAKEALSGVLIHKLDKVTLNQDNISILEIIEHQINQKNENDVIYISLQDQKFSQEEINILAGYAKMPFLGCVWPFRNTQIRTAYTNINGGLLPIQSVRSAFSYFTGNILTGPTDGLFIEVKKLKVVLAKIRHESDLIDSKIISKLEYIGPIIGLVCLSSYYRNISVSEVIYNQDLNFLKFPEELVPYMDPYI